MSSLSLSRTPQFPLNPTLLYFAYYTQISYLSPAPAHPLLSIYTSCMSSHYFSRSFFVRFLNLVTHTLVYSFRLSLVIPVFHLAFMLSTCYSTNDSHELLWFDDYTLHFALILHSHSFIRWNEDQIDFFETSDGYTLTNRFLERSLVSIITFLRQPFLARVSKVPALDGLWSETALHYDWSESSLESPNSS